MNIRDEDHSRKQSMHGSFPDPNSSALIYQNKIPMASEDDIMELLWKDGHIVVQTHPHYAGGGDAPATRPATEGVGQGHHALRFFMQEDEIADVWDYYEDPFSGVDLWRFDEAGPSESSSFTGESMVVDSTPARAAGSSSFVGHAGGGVWSSGAVKSEIMTPAAAPEPEVRRPRSAEDRKRAGGDEQLEGECSSKDAKLKGKNLKKARSGPTALLSRSRSAEVHNRSERKRRDKINEKIKALQELIPYSAKADKASTLEEVIEYLKTLQQQVQMMSMGCGMVPMMYPVFPNTVVASPSTAIPPQFPTPLPPAAAAVTYPLVPSHMSHLSQPGLDPMDQQPPATPLLGQFGAEHPLQFQEPVFYPNFTAYPYIGHQQTRHSQ